MKHDLPNPFGDKIPVTSSLNIIAWESSLRYQLIPKIICTLVFDTETCFPDTCCPFGLKTSTIICHWKTKLFFFLLMFLRCRPAWALHAFQSLKISHMNLAFTVHTFYQHAFQFGTFYAVSHCHSHPGSSHQTDILVFPRISHFKAVKVSSQKTLLHSCLCQTGSHLYVPLIEQSKGLPSQYPARLNISADMQANINWWLAFLPLLNCTSFIKPQQGVWWFTDAYMNSLLASLLMTLFAPHSTSSPQNSTLKEVAAKFWASKLYQHKFIVFCDSGQLRICKRSLHATLFTLHQLRFTAAVYDCELTARHIPLLLIHY